MTDDDKKAFYTLIAITAEAYDVTIQSKTRLAVLFDDLREYSIDEIGKALREHRQESKWFPKVSEIIARIRPDTNQAALIAWAEMLPLLRDSRNARSPDPVTEKVVQDLGGWSRLGQQSSDQLVWAEKEFAKRYAMYVEHGVDAAKILGHRGGLRLVGRDIQPSATGE